MIQVHSPARETTPTDDGWRTYEPTGVVVVTATDQDVTRLLAAIGREYTEPRREGRKSPMILLSSL